MPNSKVSHIRKNGVYYTPRELSDCLAEPLMDNQIVSVFDPAYGEGSLLLAAEKIHAQKCGKTGSCNLRLFGCDIIPINGLLQHLPHSHLASQDFFEYSADNKFDVILMNPPYVRHHYLSNDRIAAYKSITSPYCALNLTADLWAYFLVKSVSHLRNGGSIGAILPWSFLHADYAVSLRRWLFEHFCEIKFLVVRRPYFRNANARVMLVWLRGYGKRCRNIGAAEVESVDRHADYRSLSIEQWLASKITVSQNGNSDGLLTSCRDQFGFSRLEAYVDVKLGIVTGANKFFVLSEEEAGQYGFTSKNLIPVLTNSRRLSGLMASDNMKSKKLLLIKLGEGEEFRNYILEGEKDGVHLRYHPRHRAPWFVLKAGPTPDAFFPYRISKYPYLIRNDIKAQSTNSVHRIYFKGLSETQVRWLQVSLLSVYSQLSLESNSRVYGKGVLNPNLPS